MMPLYRVKFRELCPVTPELTELICERPVQHGQKTRVFSRISPDILDRFSQFFSPYESALGADDRFVLYFPICQGTLACQSNNVGRNEKVMKAD